MQVVEQAKKDWIAGKFHLRQEIDYPKIRQFLESKARKSWRTSQTYMTSLIRFNRFLVECYPASNVETVLVPLKSKEIDPYKLLDAMIAHIQVKQECSPGTVVLTFAAVSSYFQYHDVEINPAKFKNKCPLPSLRKEDETPLDHADIRKILLGITSKKLKLYCLILASGGSRATETLAIRYRDIDLSQSPTKIYMRAEFAKNRLPREIYISDEATTYLKRWIDEKNAIRERMPDELIFAMSTTSPDEMYGRISDDFRNVLKIVEMDQRKGGKLNRHAISLHSFRRFCETAVEDNTSLSYADYILGHKKSVYYGHKEPERRRIYGEKCMQALTFLDYEKIDAHAKTIEQKIVKDEKVIDSIQTSMIELREENKSMRADIRAMVEVIGALTPEERKKALEIALIRAKETKQ